MQILEKISNQNPKPIKSYVFITMHMINLQQSLLHLFNHFRFGFEGRIWVLIAQVPGHCILATFISKCSHLSI